MIMRGYLSALLLVLTALLPSPASAEWREATSEHFVVVSGGSERELIRLSQRLEAVHWMLAQLTSVTPGDDAQKVRIYLVDNISDVHRAMGVRNVDVAGFYRADVGGAIAVVPRNQGEFSTTILFHEYAHHFMLQYLQRVYPPWLVEGFAEFASTASFETDGKISIGRPATHRAYELGTEPWVPLSRMFAQRSADDERAGVASYGQYWLAAHYLIMDTDRRAQLNGFLNAYNSGASFDDALGQFTSGLDQLDRDMRAHLRRGRFTYAQIDLPADVLATPVVRVMREGEAALVPLELQASRSLDDEERTTLISQVNRLSARFPEDDAIHYQRAQLLFAAKDWAGTMAAADHVLADDPTHGRAATLRARAAINARVDSDTEVPMIEAAQLRRPIIAANRASPNDPMPLIAFYDSYRLFNQQPSESAVRGLVRASELVPQEPGLRMQAVLTLLDTDSIERSQRLTAARFLLAPVAYAPHSSGLQRYALRLVKWIDGGGEGDGPPDDDLPEPEFTVAGE